MRKWNENISWMNTHLSKKKTHFVHFYSAFKFTITKCPYSGYIWKYLLMNDANIKHACLSSPRGDARKKTQCSIFFVGPNHWKNEINQLLHQMHSAKMQSPFKLIFFIMENSVHKKIIHWQNQISWFQKTKAIFNNEKETKNTEWQ